MSYDPYSSYADEPRPGVPADELIQRPVGETERFRGRVLAPAICLIVIGFLNLFMAAAPALYGMGAAKIPPEQLEAEMEKQNPKQLEDAKAQGWTVAEIRNILVYGSFSCAILDFLASFLVILGGVRMLMMKNYVLAVFAAILAAIPVVSCSGCCGLGALAGIWALVVLVNPDVKAAFQ
jgi:hypothetical protein